MVKVFLSWSSSCHRLMCYELAVKLRLGLRMQKERIIQTTSKVGEKTNLQRSFELKPRFTACKQEARWRLRTLGAWLWVETLSPAFIVVLHMAWHAPGSCLLSGTGVPAINLQYSLLISYCLLMCQYFSEDFVCKLYKPDLSWHKKKRIEAAGEHELVSTGTPVA